MCVFLAPNTLEKTCSKLYAFGAWKPMFSSLRTLSRLSIKSSRLRLHLHSFSEEAIAGGVFHLCLRSLLATFCSYPVHCAHYYIREYSLIFGKVSAPVNSLLYDHLALVAAAEAITVEVMTSTPSRLSGLLFVYIAAEADPIQSVTFIMLNLC